MRRANWLISFTLCVLALLLVVTWAAAHPSAPQAYTTRVSLSTGGVQGNDASYPGPGGISADGRFIAFASMADNLVPADVNQVDDVFVRDRTTGETTIVSVASNGALGDGHSGHYSNWHFFANRSLYGAALSADGNLVVFVSRAGNLVPGDTNQVADIFTHDRTTGQTTRVSVSSSGAQGLAGDSYDCSVSADGRYVAFVSRAYNLVPNDNNEADVFLHDRVTGQTTLASVDSSGVQGNGWARDTAISADGRYVVFSSEANNLVPNDTNNAGDIFVHDRVTGQTTRVSVDSSGAQANWWSDQPSISADGTVVVFTSAAGNLVPGDNNGSEDVFARNRTTNQTVLVSANQLAAVGNRESNGPWISADGRWVAFSSWASNLVSGDTNALSDIFLRDLQLGQTQLISVAMGGGPSNGGSPPGQEISYQALSANGAVIAFGSFASNLAPGDTNAVDDVFVRDLLQATPTPGPSPTPRATPTPGPTWTPIGPASVQVTQITSAAPGLSFGLLPAMAAIALVAALARRARPAGGG